MSEQPKVKVCIGCESEQGQPHKDWCPVVTGTLRSLDRRPEPPDEIDQHYEEVKHALGPDVAR